MSNFRGAHEKAHPNKSNTLLLAIITLLVLIVSMQIWLLYTGLNNALSQHPDIAWITFIVSFVLFVAALGLLYYLPERK
ncbi:MAG TPA: DUF6755 family protein [Chitinophaga sp.]|jgi:O-antigen/teichoic acid export membrane protein|uniref:DUF6755 family protein n=1 Tax=Chitinophaga sp. TaxID=1869181 RepID=UPI002DB635B3|nr:DUF6755 family protein [Chitinophaga sp.]HEU4551568.1 DUF6755 family protein [Chitinophaga sp.]